MIGGHEHLFAIGDSFMQKYFTVFDRDTNTIGIAEAIHTVNEVQLMYDTSGHFSAKVEYERL
jgi:hypothetical protein